MPKDIDILLKRLKIKDLNALSKLSESALKLRGTISNKEMATVYSSLVMSGLRLAHEAKQSPTAPVDCAAVCNYEVIEKRAIAVAGQVTTVHVKCTEGNRVLGGGYDILTPIAPSFGAQGVDGVRPAFIVIQNGPRLMEYVPTQGPRHVSAIGWDVQIFFTDFVSVPNFATPEVWVYAIAAKANEATSGAGYFDPYDPHAWDSD